MSLSDAQNQFEPEDPDELTEITDEVMAELNGERAKYGSKEQENEKGQLCPDERKEKSVEIEPAKRKYGPFIGMELEEALDNNEMGDARLFIKAYRDRLCYDHAFGKWFVWAEHFWREDKTHEALAALGLIVAYYAERAQYWFRKSMSAEQEGVAASAKERADAFRRRVWALQTTTKCKNVLTLAVAGENSLGLTGEEWDKDPRLLAFPNGVLELGVGKVVFRAGRPRDYARTIIPTIWPDKGLEEPAPLWERFLWEIFDGERRPELAGRMVKYMQRLLGYALSGQTNKHVFPILYSHGRNGKGTLLEVIADVLGPLAGPVRAEMLLVQRLPESSRGPTSDIMSLMGSLICWASETDEGRRLNAGKIKWLCGGDTLIGRPPYGKREVSFRPSHTLFLLTNFKPRANGNDYALWQRIHLIPFALSFVDEPRLENERPQDKDLHEKLKAEAGGIVAWLVRGWLDYCQQGLNPPAEIKTATSQYQQDEDFMGRFLSECCLVDPKNPDQKVKAGDLHTALNEWCQEQGFIRSVGRKRLKDYLLRIGIQELPRTNRGVFYAGIGLITSEHEDPGR